MRVKLYFCIACYNINNMRHKHAFDFNFPPDMFPVVLPHFFFPVVSLSCCHFQSWLIQYCILVFLMTHQFYYISHRWVKFLHYIFNPTFRVCPYLTQNWVKTTQHFLDLHFSGCFKMHFCQIGLSGHSIQCCNNQILNQVTVCHYDFFFLLLLLFFFLSRHKWV